MESKSADVSDFELVKFARQSLAATQLEQRAEDSLSEDGLALQFVRRYPDFRYCAEWGSWLWWDGVRWARDRKAKFFKSARELAREVCDGRDDLTRRRLGSAKTMAAIGRIAQSDERVAVVPEDFDADPLKLNTPDGVVDLETGSLSPNDPNSYHTKITAVGPEGECPIWINFLSEVLPPDCIEFAQRVIGYCLTGLTQEQALFFLYGTGGNGKGVFLNTLAAVLHDYARTAPMTTFTESNRQEHATELASLQGARLVIAQETEQGKAWAESKLKQLTGGDPISARYMRQDYFEYLPQFKLIIAGNHKPRIKNLDEAMRRRLYLIPFTVTIPNDKRDPGLQEKLKGEYPGILNWALHGCLDYLGDGLRPPQSVQDATAEYFQTFDVLGDWIAECCEVGNDFWEPPKLLYSSWKQYCEQVNETPGQQCSFKERLHAAGYPWGRDNRRGRFHQGLRLKVNPVDESALWSP